MKTALCFSGQVRTFEKAWPNIIENIINPILEYSSLDLYGVFPHTNQFIDQLQWKKLLITPDKSFEISSKFGKNARHDPTKINGLLNMWNNWKLANELTKSCDEYDWVFKVRPDSWFIDKIEDLRKLEKDYIYVPNHDDWGGVNDRFAFGAPHVLDKYVSMIDNCEEIFNNGFSFHVETFLKINLEKSNIIVRRTKASLHLLREHGLHPIIWT